MVKVEFRPLRLNRDYLGNRGESHLDISNCNQLNRLDDLRHYVFFTSAQSPILFCIIFEVICVYKLVGADFIDFGRLYKKELVKLCV